MAYGDLDDNFTGVSALTLSAVSFQTQQFNADFFVKTSRAQRRISSVLLIVLGLASAFLHQCRRAAGSYGENRSG
jgi:hypothetical protein